MAVQIEVLIAIASIVRLVLGVVVKDGRVAHASIRGLMTELFLG